MEVLCTRKKSSTSKISSALASKHIADCGFRTITKNRLRSFNIRNVGELVSHTEVEVKSIRSLGVSVFREIETFLKKNNLSFDMKGAMNKIEKKKKGDDYGGLVLIHTEDPTGFN